MNRDSQEELQLTANYADRMRIQLDGTMRTHAEEVGRLKHQISMLETMAGITVEDAQKKFDTICVELEHRLKGSVDGR